MIINSKIIGDLRESYGDSFYILDSKQFTNNFIELKSAFSSIYPNFNIAYSYKTNYLPKLGKIVNELGGYAEVVSEMELDIALKLGIQANRIIWNGPIKNSMRLEEFLILGGTVNVDSVEELDLIKSFKCKYPNILFNLGLRCNFDVGDGVISRFGFDIYTDDFKDAVSYITKTENLQLVNFHCHFAKRNVEYWPARAKGMIDLIDSLGIIPKRIDIGGGLFGKMEDSLKCQFSSEIPDYNVYAEAAATVFADYFKNKDVMPELLIEPGSALVGDCMKFVCTVKTIKCIRGKYFASVLGSQKNISMYGVNPPIEVISMGGKQFEYADLDFVGFTCIEGDVLYKNYNGMLAKDDVIIISNCGSYSIVMKPPFILPNFPILDLSEGYVDVIKREETFEDLFQTYTF